MSDGLLLPHREFPWADIDRVRRDHGLLGLSLELSRRCDSDCVYCYRGSGQPESGELSWTELLDAARQALELGARDVCIVGAGEPTLDPRLPGLLRFLRPHCRRLDVFTNGSGMTPELTRLIVELGVEVAVKLESLDTAVHDRITRRPGSGAAALETLERLRAAGHPPAAFRTQTVVTKWNLEGIPALWRWNRDRGHDPFVERLIPQGRARDFDLMPAPGQVHSLFREIQRIDREEYGRSWALRPVWLANACLRHFFTCLIDSRGRVLPCGGVDIAVGDLRTQTLADILKTSAVLHDLRHIDRRIKGACASCAMARECYGCRGAAYQMSGDYLAEDPFCWRSHP